MKLGLSLGYWGRTKPEGVEDQVRLAEELGFDSMWTAEAYGSDALTPLAWLGAHTKHLRLGTSIAQMSARTPTATAMAAMTLDTLSNRRFILGLGVSGPQVVEGWYGQPFPKPLERTREYVDIVRKVFAREEVSYDGKQYQLPYPGGMGLGKPLRTILHPLRQDIPIFLGSEGPKNVALTAEIADGWLPAFYSPYHDARYRAALDEGFARPTARHTRDTFEVAGLVGVAIADNIEDAANELRPIFALYIGGMGAKGANFHYEVFARMGYEEQCAKIQELFLAGRKKEAMAAVSVEMIEQVSLIGPKDKVAKELQIWEDSLLTIMAVNGRPETLRTLAELVAAM